MRPLWLRAVGAVSAAGEGAAALFDAAAAARPLAAPVERYDVGGLKTRRAALLPPAVWARTQARWPGLDPAVSLSLLAIEQACPAPRPGAALLVGTSLGCIASWEPWHRALTLGQPAPPAPRGGHGDVAWQAAEALGLRGPALTVSTACSSASAALLMAADMIALGEIGEALVVGVDVLSTFVHAGFDSLRALSPDDRPPSPFAPDRAGLWLGEGAACAWISGEGPGEALLLGGCEAGDGHHMTSPEPGGRGMIEAIRGALARAEISPGEVRWVSAHATGTPHNDAMEARALREIFGDAMPPVHGLKPVIGHTLGASGLLGVALIVEALRRRRRPPTAGAEGEGDARLPRVPLDAGVEPLEPGPVLALSAAFAGHNAALLVGPP